MHRAEGHKSWIPPHPSHTPDELPNELSLRQLHIDDANEHEASFNITVFVEITYKHESLGQATHVLCFFFPRRQDAPRCRSCARVAI